MSSETEFDQTSRLRDLEIHIHQLRDQSLIGSSSLIESILTGDMDAVERVVSLEPECVISRSLNSGSYPIHLASLQNKLDIVRFLAEVVSKSVLFETLDGLTPLHVASYAGHADLCEFLVDFNVSAASMRTMTAQLLPEDIARLAGHIGLSERLATVRTCAGISDVSADDQITSRDTSPISKISKVTLPAVSAAVRYTTPPARSPSSPLSRARQEIGLSYAQPPPDSIFRPIDSVTAGPSINSAQYESQSACSHTENKTQEAEGRKRMIEEFQRASLLEEETDNMVSDNHSMTNGHLVGMPSLMMFNLSDDVIVGSVAPGGYNHFSHRPNTTSAFSGERRLGEGRVAPATLPASAKVSKVSPFIYQPVSHKITHLARPFSTKAAYSPRRLGTPSGERRRPSTGQHRTSTAADGSAAAPRAAATLVKMTDESDFLSSGLAPPASPAQGIIVTSVAVRPSSSHLVASPNARYRQGKTLQPSAAPVVLESSPRSPNALHNDAHSPRSPHQPLHLHHQQPQQQPVVLVPAPQFQASSSSSPPHSPRVRAHTEGDLVRSIALPAATMPSVNATAASSHTADTIWASSQDPMYTLHRPGHTRPTSSSSSSSSAATAYKRPGSSVSVSPSNASTAAASAGHGKVNVSTSKTATATAGVPVDATAVSALNAVAARTTIAAPLATTVLQSRALYPTAPIVSPEIPTIPTTATTTITTATTASNSHKEKIIIPKLNIGGSFPMESMNSGNIPSTALILTSPAMTSSGHQNHSIITPSNNAFAPSTVIRTKCANDLLSPAAKQGINLAQMLHSVDRIVTDPTYIPPIQPLLHPAQTNNHNNLNHNNRPFYSISAENSPYAHHRKSMNHQNSQVPRSARYEMYTHFTQPSLPKSRNKTSKMNGNTINNSHTNKTHIVPSIRSTPPTQSEDSSNSVKMSEKAPSI